MKIESEDKQIDQFISEVKTLSEVDKKNFNRHVRDLLCAEVVQAALNIPYNKWIKRHEK